MLNTILSTHPQLTGVGELTFLYEDWLDDRRHCSCGQPYRDCPYWRELATSMAPMAQMATVVRRIEQRGSLLRLLTGAFSPEERRLYREGQQLTMGHIVAQSGGSIVVDSSKSARAALGRFVALQRVAGQEVFVLHLVRNGLATMESQILTGDNWALEGRSVSQKWLALRTVIGWVTANTWVPLLGRMLGRDRYRLLRYEDFVEDPVTSLRTLGQFCGFDAEPLVTRVVNGEEFHVGHVVGGNRVRLDGKLKLRPPAKRRYGDRLRRRHRLLFMLLGGWLQRLYRYA